jgi:outer membrane protein insertion porin family
VGVGLRIYVQQLSPAPLAFDFGFPILKESTDRTRLFTFSIDVPFR